MTRAVLPGRPAPGLRLPRLGGGTFDLASEPVDRMLLIEVYRGLHCPRCHRHLLDLHSKLPHLGRRGVRALAVSMDEEDRAEEARRRWGLAELDMAHSLTLDDARAWDLYVSASISEREPGRRFAEPATFLVTPDRTIQAALYNTTPFARFSFADMLEAIETIQARDYPPRGEVDLTTAD